MTRQIEFHILADLPCMADAGTRTFIHRRTDAGAKGVRMRFIAFTLTGLVAVKLAAAQVEQQPSHPKVLSTLNPQRTTAGHAPLRNARLMLRPAGFAGLYLFNQRCALVGECEIPATSVTDRRIPAISGSV